MPRTLDGGCGTLSLRQAFTRLEPRGGRLSLSWSDAGASFHSAEAHGDELSLG
jgi:hypothetical protein